jgi:hypothetical protein
MIGLAIASPAPAGVASPLTLTYRYFGRPEAYCRSGKCPDHSFQEELLRMLETADQDNSTCHPLGTTLL